MPARQPWKGNRRIDAAIDHFAAKGYNAREVSAVVRDLLKVYGGPSPDVWRVLEEASYTLVQERLFDIEEEQKLKKDAQLLQQDGQQVEDEPPQNQEPAADEEVKDPMFTEPPARETVSQLNAARMIGPRQASYYGRDRWHGESEDEEEEQSTGQNLEVQVLRRAQYIDDQVAELAPENTEDIVVEEGEPMNEKTKDGNIQVGRRAGPPRRKKANVRLAGPEWAK